MRLRKIIHLILVSLGIFLGSASLAFAVTVLFPGGGGTGWGYPGGLEAHSVLIGNGINRISTTSPDIAGYVLTSNGTTADPTFQPKTGGTISTSTPVSAVSGLAFWTSTSTLSGTTSPTVGYITATSTTATSTFANGINLTGGCYAVDGACVVGSTGTVTSVGATVPVGLTVAGSPITTSGTLAFDLQTGYNIPLTASTTNWNSAYDTVTASSTNWDTAYTNYVSAWTAPLQYSAGTASITQSGTASDGYLSSVDWNTFNDKINLTSLSATTPLSYDNTTGVFSLNIVPTSLGGTGVDSSAYSGIYGINAGVVYQGATTTASTISGATLASNVVSSSLTGLGTITTGVWNGTSIDNTYLTNSSLTVNGIAISLGASGTVTAASSTLLIDNNIFSGADSFTNSLTIPNNTDPAITLNGQIAINTTTASSSLRYYDGTSEQALYTTQDKTLVLASTTLAYLGGYGAAGTTTMLIANYLRPTTITNIYCKTDVGSALVRFGNGTTWTDALNCSTTGTVNGTLLNNTFISRQDMEVEIGTEVGDPSLISITVTIQDNPD